MRGEDSAPCWPQPRTKMSQNRENPTQERQRGRKRAGICSKGFVKMPNYSLSDLQSVPALPVVAVTTGRDGLSRISMKFSMRTNPKSAGTDQGRLQEGRVTSPGVCPSSHPSLELVLDLKISIYNSRKSLGKARFSELFNSIIIISLLLVNYFI